MILAAGLLYRPAMTELNDQELLEKARQGDRPALEALLQRYQPHVYRFGMKMCRDPEDAGDITQDTLLAMARTVRDFRGASSVSTWLYTIARRFCIKKRRRRKGAPEEMESLDVGATGEAHHLPDPSRGPEEEVAGRQVSTALEKAIASLAPMYREVLVLRDVEGLTAPETAEVLGMTVEAVKSRLHRARVSVRDQMVPLLGIPEGEPVAAGAACPDVLTMFSKHLEGDIDSNLCAELQRHLDGCPRCKGACDSLKQTLALCKAAPLPSVPSGIQDSIRQSIKGILSSGL